LKYDFETELILIKNFLKHNPLTNPNQKKAAKKIIEDLPKSPLLKHFLGLIEGLPEGLGEVLSKPETETETEYKYSLDQNPPKKTKKPPPHANGFDAFWTHYPRKVGKPKALSSWISLAKRKRLPPLEVILQAVEGQKTWEQWQHDDGRYIPHPSTWLNREGWNDQKPAPEDKLKLWATNKTINPNF
jgi:hypothetical protein